MYERLQLADRTGRYHCERAYILPLVVGAPPQPAPMQLGTWTSWSLKAPSHTRDQIHCACARALSLFVGAPPPQPGAM